jgi:hypothetical protein
METLTHLSEEIPGGYSFYFMAVKEIIISAVVAHT